jgi:sugar phosphate isomerase/epimerase
MNKPFSRRQFLRSLTAASASLTVLPSLARSLSSKYMMGLQLFTVRDAMTRDVKDTLARVSAMGYQDTETYGFDPQNLMYYGMKAEDFKKVLTENNLTTTSGHYDLFRYLRKTDDEMKQYLDRCIGGAQALGQKYITWPWLDPESRTMESFKLLVNKLNVAGEHVTKAGLGFAYHNHDFEFIDHQGKNGYDRIMRETDAAKVKLQIDLYWASHSSNLTPAELFRKQPGRFVMWHIKDMDKVTRDYTELGNGSIDYTKILPDAQLAGLQYYYLEQGGNFATNSMQSIADSAVFFQKNLQRLL